MPVIGSCTSSGRNAAATSSSGSVPSGLLADREDGRADERGVAAGLVDEDVRLGARDRLLAAAEVRELRDEVALGAAGDEEAGFLAEQLGGALLERVDRGVVAEDVVADSASAIARRISGDGRVTVSLRMSITGMRREYSRGRPARTGSLLSSVLPRTRGVAAKHASLSRWRSPVRIRSGPPNPLGSQRVGRTSAPHFIAIIPSPVLRQDGAPSVLGRCAPRQARGLLRRAKNAHRSGRWCDGPAVDKSPLADGSPEHTF